jgi:hypothetical protein
MFYNRHITKLEINKNSNSGKIGKTIKVFGAALRENG